MATYMIRTEGTVHETYHVDADTPEAARALFENGEVTVTTNSEVDDVEIVSIEQAR